jgi:hypothetical protein
MVFDPSVEPWFSILRIGELNHFLLVRGSLREGGLKIEE